MPHFRHFSRAQADVLRPWVAEQVHRMREARDVLASTDDAASLAIAAAISGGSRPGGDHARAAVTYALALDALVNRDIVVRDLDRGWIDFPSIVGGHEGYLCWLVDEPQIGDRTPSKPVTPAAARSSRGIPGAFAAP